MERIIAQLAERPSNDDSHRSPTVGGSADTTEETP
jgi:hypothetical protein